MVSRHDGAPKVSLRLAVDSAGAVAQGDTGCGFRRAGYDRNAKTQATGLEMLARCGPASYRTLPEHAPPGQVKW
jgi:hypothetical protein